MFNSDLFEWHILKKENIPADSGIFKDLERIWISGDQKYQ